eukprot:TRINITY_DN3209_c0_g1_i4.p1 TRINITY_DN3209_c0_g1~~TRINITY_DN3209_c0_g1_i4.p1  ORF type:complete len:200 (-),score=63.64 TRINITY_DN3209_c0_g1_i4:128-727(-)
MCIRDRYQRRVRGPHQQVAATTLLRCCAAVQQPPEAPGPHCAATPNSEFDLFLGGSCNPTTWREDTAIPMCQQHNISYYNPQVADWHDGLVEVEASAKENAKVLLFVIDNTTRALASCLEATEFICVGRVVSLVVLSDLLPGCIIDGEEVGKGELKDLNRARRYLKDVADRHGCVVHDDVRSGMLHVTELFSDEVCGMF